LFCFIQILKIVFVFQGVSTSSSSTDLIAAGDVGHAILGLTNSLAKLVHRLDKVIWQNQLFFCFVFNRSIPNNHRKLLSTTKFSIWLQYSTLNDWTRRNNVKRHSTNNSLNYCRRSAKCTSASSRWTSSSSFKHCLYCMCVCVFCGWL